MPVTERHRRAHPAVCVHDAALASFRNPSPADEKRLAPASGIAEGTQGAIPRNLEAGDIVGAVMWLVSDESRFVTGQTIAVDGGTVFS